MEKFNGTNSISLDEKQLYIYDSQNSHFGGNQYWYPKKFHQLSGCGPIAAANITAYLAQTFPNKYRNLFAYEGLMYKNNFLEHMIEIRKFVKPGIFGLTSVHQFSDNVLAFSKKRELTLTSHILDDKAAKIEAATSFIIEALTQKLPIAILILKHPIKEFEEYTWHWMTITGLRLDSKDNIYYISVSTYGERREINLNMLWNERLPKHIIGLTYFT